MFIMPTYKIQIIFMNNNEHPFSSTILYTKHTDFSASVLCYAFHCIQYPTIPQYKRIHLAIQYVPK